MRSRSVPEVIESNSLKSFCFGHTWSVGSAHPTFLNSDVFKSAWYKFEQYLGAIAVDENKEVYIISGGIGSASNLSDYINNPPYKPNEPFPQSGINYPEETWKIAVILDPGQTIADISRNTRVIAIITPNEKVPSNLTPDELAEWRNWRNWRVSVDDIEAETGLDLLSNIPKQIQDYLESTVDISSALMAEENITLFNLRRLLFHPSGFIKESAVFPEGFKEESSRIESKQISGTSEIISYQNNFTIQNSYIVNADTDIGEISFIKNSRSQDSLSQTSMREVYSATNSPTQISPIQIGMGQIGIGQVSSTQISSAQISVTEIGATQISTHQVSPAKINLPQIGIFQGYITEEDVSKITLTSSVSSQHSSSFHQFSFDSHNSNPQLTNIYSTAQTLWHTTTPIDLAFKIQDLPTGQLAEGTITSYNTNGTPKTATITIDDDANGIGWFIDTTPGDSSEFQGVGVLGSGGVGEYFQATANSAAAGKYDLLTAILHEMGHTLGIINGYSEFDKHIKNGIFTTDTFTTKLTPDGSHLNSTLYPYDLMNTSLKPGVRKLPSAMDWAIINAISGSGGVGALGSNGVVNPAHLTAGALIGITNGDFTTPTTWNTVGATNIINGTATLTEQSQKLSELTQAFIIPTGAKMLQFTIKDNHLVESGVRSQESGVNNAPDDAFEVALLDTNTFNPLAGISQGLTHTDSLLNIQADGTIHKSDKVTITALTNNSSIVTIDLTQVTPTTQATLYFNLLGFGARTSTVTIDDVKLFTDIQPIPVTKNDTLNTNQNTPLTLDPTQLTTNDTNVSQIQIINQPTHGTLTQTPDGKLTYQPVPTYIGNDSFTYLGFGSDGQISTLAKDGGTSDNLTYTWNLGDGSNPITGQNIAHTYTDNGNYQVTLTATACASVLLRYTVGKPISANRCG
jgi:hypothetical protein